MIKERAAAMKNKELRIEVRRLMKIHKLSKRDVKGNTYREIYDTLSKEPIK